MISIPDKIETSFWTNEGYNQKVHESEILQLLVDRMNDIIEYLNTEAK